MFFVSFYVQTKSRDWIYCVGLNVFCFFIFLVGDSLTHSLYQTSKLAITIILLSSYYSSVSKSIRQCIQLRLVVNRKCKSLESNTHHGGPKPSANVLHITATIGRKWRSYRHNIDPQPAQRRRRSDFEALSRPGHPAESRIDKSCAPKGDLPGKSAQLRSLQEPLLFRRGVVGRRAPHQGIFVFGLPRKALWVHPL